MAQGLEMPKMQRHADLRNHTSNSDMPTCETGSLRFATCLSIMQGFSRNILFMPTIMTGQVGDSPIFCTQALLDG